MSHHPPSNAIAAKADNRLIMFNFLEFNIKLVLDFNVDEVLVLTKTRSFSLNEHGIVV